MERKYSADERKEILKALQIARQYIWNGDGPLNPKLRFICSCIHYGRYLRLVSSQTVMDAISLIYLRIDEQRFLEYWVGANVPGTDVAYLYYNPKGQKIMQEYSQRWLDELIREFSN